MFTRARARVRALAQQPHTLLFLHQHPPHSLCGAVGRRALSSQNTFPTSVSVCELRLVRDHKIGARPLLKIARRH
eukprot:1840237-Prymnesium_polylepis.1